MTEFKVQVFAGIELVYHPYAVNNQFSALHIRKSAYYI